MAPLSHFKGNLLLQSLTSSDLALLEPNLVPVTLRLREDIERPNRRIDHVFFAETGIISVVSVLPDETRVEIGLIGGEGMSGTAIVLGDDRSVHATFVQAAGTAHRIPSHALRAALDESPSMRTLLLKYVQAFILQTAHTAIANARATLAQRLARWLLMAHDRVPGNRLELTHEFLSVMLGVRRAGVTEAIHELVKQKVIQAKRGTIILLSRKGAEKIAGKFYGVPESEYRRLIR